MTDGISGTALPAGIVLPYGPAIARACYAATPPFPPCLAYAIKVNESGENDPPDVVSYDNGHGLFQLTSSWPANWRDPCGNATFAIAEYLQPAWDYWARNWGLQGDDLVRAIAAEFNAGRSQTIAGHVRGDVDLYTTNGYAARALSHFTALVAGREPW